MRVCCPQGLGKTLQVLYLIMASPRDPLDVDETFQLQPAKPLDAGSATLKYPGARPGVTRARSAATLVLCPVTLVTQWKLEIEKHCPDMEYVIWHGARRNKVTVEDLLTAEIVLSTYSMLPSEQLVLAQIDFHRVVYDESQVCCNASNVHGMAGRHNLTHGRAWVVRVLQQHQQPTTTTNST